MSGINGDKSRFNRERKQKIARRLRNRELLSNVGPTKLSLGVAAGKEPQKVKERTA